MLYVLLRVVDLLWLDGFLVVLLGARTLLTVQISGRKPLFVYTYFSHVPFLASTAGFVRSFVRFVLRCRRRARAFRCVRARARRPPAGAFSPNGGGVGRWGDEGEWFGGDVEYNRKRCVWSDVVGDGGAGPTYPRPHKG